MPSDLIAAAAVIVGFGVTVFMFRVQRELYVLEVLEEKRLWLAWADYLIIGSVSLAVFGVILPLLATPAVSANLVAWSASLCVAAVVLQAGYIPSILAHYRIELGARREGPRAKGEPIERRLVIMTAIAALAAFSLTIWLRIGKP